MKEYILSNRGFMKWVMKQILSNHWCIYNLSFFAVQEYVYYYISMSYFFQQT